MAIGFNIRALLSVLIVLILYPINHSQIDDMTNIDRVRRYVGNMIKGLSDNEIENALEDLTLGELKELSKFLDNQQRRTMQSKQENTVNIVEEDGFLDSNMKFFHFKDTDANYPNLPPVENVNSRSRRKPNMIKILDKKLSDTTNFLQRLKRRDLNNHQTSEMENEPHKEEQYQDYADDYKDDDAGVAEENCYNLDRDTRTTELDVEEDSLDAGEQYDYLEGETAENMKQKNNEDVQLTDEDELSQFGDEDNEKSPQFVDEIHEEEPVEKDVVDENSNVARDNCKDLHLVAIVEDKIGTKHNKKTSKIIEGKETEISKTVDETNAENDIPEGEKLCPKSSQTNIHNKDYEKLNSDDEDGAIDYDYNDNSQMPVEDYPKDSEEKSCYPKDSEEKRSSPLQTIFERIVADTSTDYDGAENNKKNDDNQAFANMQKIPGILTLELPHYIMDAFKTRNDREKREFNVEDSEEFQVNEEYLKQLENSFPRDYGSHDEKKEHVRVKRL